MNIIMDPLINNFPDDLMKSMQQVKRILHAKWSKSSPEATTQQEDLTAEAERLLKKTQSNIFSLTLPFTRYSFFFRKQGVRSDYRLRQQNDHKVQLIESNNAL